MMKWHHSPCMATTSLQRLLASIPHLLLLVSRDIKPLLRPSQRVRLDGYLLRPMPGAVTVVRWYAYDVLCLSWVFEVLESNLAARLTIGQRSHPTTYCASHRTGCCCTNSGNGNRHALGRPRVTTWQPLTERMSFRFGTSWEQKNEKQGR